MPTTRARKLNLNGFELSVTLDRMAAERVKSVPGIKRLLGRGPLRKHHGHEPEVHAKDVNDLYWYHVIDLGNGVVTPGFVDHRPQLDLYGLPASLAGKRCLDVATFDGFWAFEMERRGAAEVVGIDLHSRADCDFPQNWRKEFLSVVPDHVKGEGFTFARRALKSKARRRVLSVYEMSPERLGTFDFVFMSDLLLHLRDPFRALENLWTVTRPGGTAIIADAYDVDLEASGQGLATRFQVVLDDYSGCHWWSHSVSALKAMIHGARFSDIEEISRFVLPTNGGAPVPKVVFRARRTE
jgi:tRNA (mo5U34)-methyltransferase